MYFFNMDLYATFTQMFVQIRSKRLAKLQGLSPPVSSGPSSAGTPATTTPVRTPAPPKPIHAPSPRSTPPTVVSTPPPAKKKAPSTPVHLDLPKWEHEMISNVFKVTLDKEEAERSGWESVWLKSLASELDSEISGSTKLLSEDLIDSLLIARLELNPQTMSDDLEFLPVLASLPAEQTVFEYLVGCWRRLNGVRSSLLKRNYLPVQVEKATAKLDKVRDLIISYAGFTLQDPGMFPQPPGKPIGAPELVAPLVSLSSLSAPLLSGSTTISVLSPTEVEPFLQDLARRFEQDNELDGVLGDVVYSLCHHPSLFRPEGLAGSDSTWRGIISGLEALVGIKSIAVMITRLPSWNPAGTAANNFEIVSLFGPLLRLGIFSREWPQISATYFTKPSERRGQDMESAIASLRGTLKTLQSSLFQIFNSLVRASAESREGVLQFFARVIALNDRRAGMQVDPNTVSSDTFMTNLQAILFRFCEPFMDANYTKIDRIERLYFAFSNRIDLKDETRVNATTKEAEEWVQQLGGKGAAAQNFISDIFYLTLAMNHRGYMKTISNYEDLQKESSELHRHVEMLEGDGSWRGTPLQARMEHALNTAKAEQDKIEGMQLAYKTQLADPELVFRSVSFVNFVSTWIIRFVDPKRTHPNPLVELPLPNDVPLEFRMQPEFLLEDVIDYHVFLMRETPQSLELSGKNEMLVWSLTFLTSTWYIKNPFLKNKMIEALSWGVMSYDGRRSLLSSLVNTHPLALKHLVSALVHFYIEVEQTGASSQFYDKFSTFTCLFH
ncbi:hypothetical protein QCA50_019312 [Cerrena zonata]|uniref:Ubiquitin conjugation factor E4 core domain-containing protein n=1 Tax=Cerrena zonata TaxID=2478898 RepID=A0AAW0F9H8_9APHY